MRTGDSNGGKMRQLVAERRLLSAQLAQWFQQLGLTPDARSTFAAKLAGKGLGEEIRRRLEEVRAQREAAA